MLLLLPIFVSLYVCTLASVIVRTWNIDRVFSKERHPESCNGGVADKIVIDGTRDRYFVCSVSAGEIEDFSDSGLVWLFSYNNLTASNIGESTSDKLRMQRRNMTDTFLLSLWGRNYKTYSSK